MAWPFLAHYQLNNNNGDDEEGAHHDDAAGDNATVASRDAEPDVVIDPQEHACEICVSRAGSGTVRRRERLGWGARRIQRREHARPPLNKDIEIAGPLRSPPGPDAIPSTEVLLSVVEPALRGGSTCIISSLSRPMPTKAPSNDGHTDVVSPDIRNTPYVLDHLAKELDGRELVFLNDKRPVSRLLYFHFVMALVRMKDVGRRGWREVWARYYSQRPFPMPGNYMRQSMLLALTTHFEVADMHAVGSWIRDHGFDSPLKLTDDEAAEAARRVHVAVEAAIRRAKEGKEPDHDGSDDGCEDTPEKEPQEDAFDELSLEKETDAKSPGGEDN
ncbi:hypothetical protein SPI_05685 [Niveomyces insectorum RCEF 264]|uniref:Uncharacterized protein n=1 Tax=Niveomyces insectorum RCEF 264 TaxID=1081102 RepID=A0A167TFY9_9HYPO|nr:hypothetical protein SPI_05685 [Niveomyces insectorum RCEF 264]